MALAYFITFTTYGTWLHGTEKGMGSVDRKHNAYGSDFIVPNLELESDRGGRMSQPVYVMDAPRRDMVLRAMTEFCTEKSYPLVAVHVRSNHVHIVVSADREPGRLMSEMKARASRELTRAGFDSADRIRWTRHGSTRHLFDPEEVDSARQYTLFEQGTPMSCYDGTTKPRTK